MTRSESKTPVETQESPPIAGSTEGVFWSAQKAIYKILTSSALLQSALAAGEASAGAKIYDGAPQGAEFPYITFGDARLARYIGSIDDFAEHELDILVWSRQESGGETKRLLDMLIGILEGAPLADETYHAIRAIDALRGAAERRRDGTHWLGTLTLRLLIERTSRAPLSE